MDSFAQAMAPDSTDYPLPSAGPSGSRAPDIDDSDGESDEDIPDWRALSRMLAKSAGQPSTSDINGAPSLIPKRGEKEYQPTRAQEHRGEETLRGAEKGKGTSRQERALMESRDALFGALSGERRIGR